MCININDLAAAIWVRAQTPKQDERYTHPEFGRNGMTLQWIWSNGGFIPESSQNVIHNALPQTGLGFGERVESESMTTNEDTQGGGREGREQSVFPLPFIASHRLAIH